MVAANADTYRYERKFVAATLSRPEVETAIRFHPAIFREVYPPRFINNIYFDSLGFSHYHDNKDGVRDRVKARIRWYGDLFRTVQQPRLELKIKLGAVMRKEVYPLGPLTVDHDLRYDHVAAAFRNADIPEMLRTDLLCLRMTLLNRYCRKYYLSACRAYRITVDWDLSYYRIVHSGNLFVHKQTDHTSVIVELKYPIDRDAGSSKIAAHLPFRVDRFSKYATGIEQIYEY